MELTRLEQKMTSILKDGEIITINNLYRLNELLKFSATSTVKAMAFNLVKKGVLVRLSRGRYLVSKTPEKYDPLRTANYVFDGYIAFSSALFVYGYNPTRSFTVWGASSQRKTIRKIGEYIYISVPMGRLTFGSTYYKGYRVSTRSKTVFDCIYKIHYVEDMRSLLDAIHDMGSKDFDELIGYLKEYGSSSITQKVGFVLEKAGAPRGILKIIQSVAGKSIARLDNKSDAPSRYDPKWHILDNINFARFSK